MPELQLHDDVLPFKCDNPDCEEEYDSESFAKVIMLWGFICLISEENEVALVGLTCPKCKKTTIQKYRGSVAMQFVWTVQETLKYKFMINGNFPLKDWWGQKYYSATHLYDLGFIEAPDIKQDSSNDIIYYPLSEIKFLEYSDELSENSPFSLNEEDVFHFLKNRE